MYHISNLPDPLQGRTHETTRPVDPLLTCKEAAQLLGCGLSTFHRWVAQGLVNQPLKLGGTSRWPQSEVLAVIERAKAQRDTNTHAKEIV